MACLSHDRVHERDLDGAENCGQGPHAQVGHASRDVFVANVLELKVALEAGKPACKGQEEFGKGRVDIKEIFASDVVCSKFAKVDFIEYDLIRMPATRQAGR